MELDMRVYQVDLDGDLHDLRGQKGRPSRLSITNDKLRRGPAFWRETLREGRVETGIAYDSIRRTGGECVAVFRPPLLSDARQERASLLHMERSRD